MIRRRFFTLAAASAVVLATRGMAQNAPQPELPKEKLVIVTHDGKRHDFTVEMALNNTQQVTGLMFRPMAACCSTGGQRAPRRCG